MRNGDFFFRVYADHLNPGTIVEIGSQDVNGSLRNVAARQHRYIGLDFVPGNGVDMVITDPYSYPLESDSADLIVTSSCFEHSEFFWLTLLEAMRILKPTGVMYINAPSNGGFHRYPVDCWRFYPDAGYAMANWCKRSGMPNVGMLESFTSHQAQNVDLWNRWNDFNAVLIKDVNYLGLYPRRIHQHRTDFDNLRVYGSDAIHNKQDFPQDLRR